MIGSYYNVPPAMYQPPPPGTPGWQEAPVPGWGVNPWRAGPQRVGVGQNGLSGYYVPGARGGVPGNDGVLPRYTGISGCAGGCGCRGTGAAGDQYRTMTAGHVALAAAGGILIGMTFMWAWKERKA